MSPLILITGFPGSGKTSFLRSALPLLKDAGWSPSVIINDFENAGSTAESLAGEAKRIIPIGGACISRDARENFFNALAETPTADNTILLVEASPAAEPIELLESLTIDPRAAAFTRPIQIAAVDAMRWQRRGGGDHLEGMQVITAPYLLINRIGELKKSRRAKVEHAILGLNPFARPTTAQDFVKDIAPLRTTKDPGKFPDHLFTTLTFPLAEEVDRESLTGLLDHLPREIIRAKGIAKFKDTPDRFFLFQKIDGIKDIDFHELDESAHPDPLLIAIGPNLPSQTLRDSAAAQNLLPPA